MSHKLKHIEISDADIEKFFEHSEKGLHKEDVRQSHFQDGFNALVNAKVWRGRHMEMYEDGVLEGSMPYMTILEGVPDSVREFMAKEMFRGKDYELIMKLNA